MKKLIFFFACLFLAIPCQARIITVDDNESADFNNIQAAINDANDGDTISVVDGTYTGQGNRDINFLGKAITVRSQNGPETCIIDCNGSEAQPHQGFYFHNGEGANSVLDGFTITNGNMSGIRCYAVSPTIRNCIITKNTGGGIWCVHCYGVTITNCIITENLAITGGGIDCSFGMMGIGFNDIIVTNCTFSTNTAEYGGAIYIGEGSNPSMVNCILWGDSASYGPEIAMTCLDWGSQLSITFSNVQGGKAAVYDKSYLHWGPGNIEADPCFADPCNGDYHLKSQADRWDPNIIDWVTDTSTSPCIDAGNPGCPLGDEPNEPNNIRINMGAYSGTAQASKSPANWRNIADITNDWIVDFNDFKVFVDYWLNTGQCIPSDLSRNRFVDFNDFAIFSGQWSQPSASEPGMTFQIDDCNMEAGQSWPVAAESNEPRFSVWVEGHYIHFEDLMYANCCPDELGLDKEINGNQITLYEIGYGGLCDCMCYFPITATLGPFEDGTYTVEVFDNYGQSLGVVEVTIGETIQPGITYQIEDCNQETPALFSAEQPGQTRFTATVDGQYIHFEDMMVANCCTDKLGLEMTVEENLITIYEIEYIPGACFCICDYPVTATLGPFQPGIYTLEVYEDWGGFIGSTIVVIGRPE
ncbi:MAG TPA: right-handed parallel beta-helix repeat-containing protein [Sedimentisphaerales bacterium]|nr:right-handed parallel beta-helix repeat-containing protein [Sedimentisphaerales bacterium]